MKKKWRLGLATAVIAGVFAMLPFGVRAEGGVAIDEANFPNEKFRNYVSRFDTSGEGELSSDEIAAVKEIDVGRRDIDDLTGVEIFTSLEKLACHNNQLTKLDVSQNTSLKELSCKANYLTELDVSKLTSLEKLYCYGNPLTKLDVRNNTMLVELVCYENQLTELDVSHNTSLTTLYCGHNQLTELDLSHNTSLEQLYSECNQLTRLDVSNFASLAWLECFDNQLTELDISGCTALEYLYCYRNRLTEFDASANKKLRALIAYGNGMTTLVLGKDMPLIKAYTAGTKETKIIKDGDKEWDADRFYDDDATMTIDPDVLVGTPTGISTAKIILENDSVTYNGKMQKPKVKSVALNGTTLKVGRDYTVTAPSGCKDAGTYTYTISGKGIYRGTVKATFKITKAASRIALKAQTKKYNGKVQAYSAKITKSGSSGKVTYAYYSDAKGKKTVKVSAVKKAGTYYVRATLAADKNHEKATSALVKFTIQKAANPLMLTVKKASAVKLATVKKNNVAVKCITVKKKAGAVSYKLMGVKKASFKKYFAVNAKTGKITVKRGLKKGTYNLTVLVTAKGDANYKKGTKSVTFKIVVK